MKNIKDICIETPANKIKDKDFMDWFNLVKSLEEALKKGKKDFNEKIFDRELKNIVGDTSEKTCLEIGFGGGRLLNEACSQFEKAIGIDIHDAFDRTSRILKEQGKSNFSLIHSNDIDLIPDASIDFVYSFIVFQHFDSWDEADKYLKMIDRVLKNDGVAMIFFGKSRTKNLECDAQRKTKRNYWWSSLKVSKDYIKENLSNFDIIQIGNYKNSNQIFSKFRKK